MFNTSLSSSQILQVLLSHSSLDNITCRRLVFSPLFILFVNNYVCPVPARCLSVSSFSASRRFLFEAPYPPGFAITSSYPVVRSRRRRIFSLPVFANPFRPRTIITASDRYKVNEAKSVANFVVTQARRPFARRLPNDTSSFLFLRKC